MQQSIDKLHISRSLVVDGKFREVESGYAIQYDFAGFKNQVFQRSPVAMANMLGLYGFIDSYFATTATVYVRWTGSDDVQVTDLLETFMEKFSQTEAIQLLTEFQYREQCRKEVRQAFQLSVDAQQEKQLIN